MFQAPVVVLGCGNTLFGDDGLAPRAVAILAEEAGQFPHVAFVDAGTSVRTLLTDLIMHPAAVQRLIVVDVVQETGREAGTIAVELIQQAAGATSLPTLGDNFLHQAPTRALLHKVHTALNIELIVITVQAACIPTLMDNSLSLPAQAALPLLQKTIQDCCRGDFVQVKKEKA